MFNLNINLMEANEIVQLIANLGFPCAMCLILLYYINEESKRHRTETDGIKQALQENTKVLTELVTLIKTLVK